MHSHIHSQSKNPSPHGIYNHPERTLTAVTVLVQLVALDAVALVHSIVDLVA